jgi:hypothetical protein
MLHRTISKETAMSFASDPQPLAKPETMLRVPVGLASPLWGLFAGVAVTGATWWWMTRWMRPQNLEAMFGAAAELETSSALQIEPEPAAASVAEVPVDLVEAVLDPVAETPAQASPDLAFEAVLETATDPAPAPVVEALVAEPEIATALTPEAPQALSEDDPAGVATEAPEPAEPSFAPEVMPSVAEPASEPSVASAPNDAAQPGLPAKTKRKAAAPKLDL